MKAEHTEVRRVAEEAAEWITRFGSSGVSRRERLMFVTWLRQSPLHVRELLLAAARDGALLRRWAATQQIAKNVLMDGFARGGRTERSLRSTR